jgi:hypothetical protein
MCGASTSWDPRPGSGGGAGTDPRYVRLFDLASPQAYQCQFWMFHVGPSLVGLFAAVAPFSAFL